MADQMEFDDILKDELPPPEKPEPEAAPEPEAKTEAAPEPKQERVQSRRKQWQDKEMDARGLRRDPETGQFVPKDAPVEAKTDEPKPEAKPEAKTEAKPEQAKEPEKPAAPQQEMTEKERAFLKAMHEERQKRQELERRLQAIEAAKAQAGAPAEAPKTFWDDPEGALARHQESIRREALNARLQVSETLARKAHADFDEKVDTFGQLIQTTPGLRERWLASPDPAEFAYTVAKNHMEFQAVGSLDAMREKIAKETELRVRAQIEAELKAKAEALAKERAALPPSLSEARSTGQPNRPVWNGPTPFDEIIGG